MSKMTKCKTCGADIASNAKACPSCGAKNKKPIYKKWWFWLIIVVVVIAIAVSGGDSEPSDVPESSDKPVKTEAPVIEYIAVDVTELFDALNANAMKAKDTYYEKYLEITGYLGTIDSSGKYIGLTANPDDFDYVFSSITCNIKSDEQRETIMEMNAEEKIIIKGKITDVGEIMGYTLNIDSISKAD